MIKTMLLGLLYSIARQYFDSDLFNRVQDLVVSLLDKDMPGDQKRELVRAAIFAEFEDIKKTTIDTIIQIVLVYTVK